MVSAAGMPCAVGVTGQGPFLSRLHPPRPLVLTQLPAGTELERQVPISRGILRASFGDGARLLVVYPDRPTRVLSGGFYAACDPEVSFDATHVLFAGKRTPADHWNIYEASVDGSEVRQITKDLGDCRGPGYQSSLYSLKPVGVPNEPEYHLTFVAGAGTISEAGGCEATCLYSCKLDGSALRRLTFNLSGVMDPLLMGDGRLLFAAWQRPRLDHGLLGRVGLFGVNLDGGDYALYASFAGKRIKHMPCATAGGLVVFVEADEVPWDGAGCLSCVTIRRPLHSYRRITGEADGLFHSPSPLEDGSILVSRRPADGSGTHGVWRFDPLDKKAELIFDDPRYHEIQAKVIRPRREPDGRSTAVSEEQHQSQLSGKFYCLSVYTSDLEQPWMGLGSVERLRVLEGVPLEIGKKDAYLPAAQRRDRSSAAAAGFSSSKFERSGLGWPGSSVSEPPETRRSGGSSTNASRWCPSTPATRSPNLEPLGVARLSGSTVHGIPPLVQRRILGDIRLEKDGSFNIEVPANTPVELQVLDAEGMALRSCGWIWVKDYARQGCIGCHEDGELTPDNVFADALERPSISLCLPPGQRRTVDFRRDVMPIIRHKCVLCHGPGEAPPRLDGGSALLSHGDGKAWFNQAYESLLAVERPEDAASYRGRYVQPGKARASRLIWHIFGKNTSRPWDGAAAGEPVKLIPPQNAPPLSDDEKRTLVEWIDLGAMWDGIPGAE